MSGGHTHASFRRTRCRTNRGASWWARPVLRLFVGRAGGLDTGSVSCAGSRSHRFALTLDGYEIATFQELSGIVSEVDPVEYWQTPVDQRVEKLKPPAITLKRGLTGGLELWSWHEAVRLGRMAQARKSVSLVMYDPEGRAVARYWLEKTWPMKMDLAGLKAGASEALIETVTLTAARIQRVSP